MNKIQKNTKKTKQQLTLLGREQTFGKVTITQPKKTQQKRLAFNPPPLTYFPEPEQRRAAKLYRDRISSTNKGLSTNSFVNRQGKITKEEMKIPMTPFNYGAPTLCSASAQLQKPSSCGQGKEDCGCSRSQTSSCGQKQNSCQQQSCCCCCCCCCPPPHHGTMKPPTVQNGSYPPPEYPPGTVIPLVNQGY